MKWRFVISPVLLSLAAGSTYYYFLDIALPNTLFGIGFHIVVMLCLLSAFPLLLWPLESLLRSAPRHIAAISFSAVYFLGFLGYLYFFCYNAFGKCEWGFLVPIPLMFQITADLPGLIRSYPIDLAPYFALLIFFIGAVGVLLFSRAGRWYATLEAWLEQKAYLAFFLGGTLAFLYVVGDLSAPEQPVKKSLPRLIYNYTTVHDPIFSLIYHTTRGTDKIQGNNLKYFNVQNWDYVPTPELHPQKNVILIIADALRADHLPLYGYERPITPFLDSLYKHGDLQLVEYATSACSSTFCGITSILKSVEWQDQGPYDFGLPDLLSMYGYQVNLLLSGTHKRWLGLDKRYGDNVDFIHDGDDSSLYVNTDDRVVLEALEKVPWSDRPQFFFIHLMSTHSFGLVQAEFQRYLPAKSSLADDFETRQMAYRNNYDNGILQLDAFIKELFQQFAARGVLDDALLVITSDHGESLGEGKTFGHCKGLLPHEIRIPLLFFDTDSITLRNKYYATHIDIAPTISSILGLAVPRAWQGTALTEPFDNRISQHVEGTYRSAVRADSSQILEYILQEDTGEEHFVDFMNHGRDVSHSLPNSTKTALRRLLYTRPSSSQ